MLLGAWSGLLENVTEFAVTIDIFESTSRGELSGPDNIRVDVAACASGFDGDGFVTGADFGLCGGVQGGVFA